MEGGSVDSGTAAIRHLAVRCPTEEEPTERTPLSPVTTNVPGAGSPSKKHARGSPFRRSIFRDNCRNQSVLHIGSIDTALQNPLGDAGGLSPKLVAAWDEAEPGSGSFYRRHASLGSVLSDSKQPVVIRSTAGPPARTASHCSDSSFSHIAEEARKLAESLDAQAEDFDPWRVKAFGDGKRSTHGTLSHPEPSSDSGAPAEHQAAVAADFEQQPGIPQEPADNYPGCNTPLLELQSSRQLSAEAGKDSQQEAHPQGTPPHSGWATLYPDAGQQADSITGSGRKRARHSISAADSSSIGQDVAVPSYAQHATPFPASASEGQHTDAPHHRQFSNDDEEHLGAITERTLALAHAGALGEILSPRSSASDQPASPPSEHSRQAALMAARAVAQVMGLQARHHNDLQAINCERVASAVDHESTLGDLDRVLRENISLQDMVLSQAQQVGALGAAQEALRRQLENQEKLQALQCSASQQQQLLTLQEEECLPMPMLPDTSGELGLEAEHRAAQGPALKASPSAQPTSQAESGSPAEGAGSQAGAARLSTDSATPSRAPPPAQATPALYGSPAQTPLGSLHRLAHMLHTPQDMAAARMQASGPAPTGVSAHDAALVSHWDSSAAERGLWTMFDSPADSCGSNVTAPSRVQPSSQPHALLWDEAAERMAWERSTPTREEQDPSFSRSGSLHASQAYASALPSPIQVSTGPQQAAKQHRPDTSASTEGQSSLFSGCGNGSGSTAGAMALRRPVWAHPRPQHAAEQARDPASAPTEALNPLFNGCGEAGHSAAEAAREHGGTVIEGHKLLCDSSEDIERAPEDLVMLPPWARDGLGDQGNAQWVVSQLQHDLQASRTEAAQAKQASAQDREALKVSRMEGEEMAAEMRRTQEWLTTLQTELLPAKQLCHVSATAGHDKNIALAGVHPGDAMLHKTLELLAAARLQIASQARPGSGEPKASPEPSPEARAAERTIAYLQEDLEMRTEQLATAQLQLEIAQSQIQARQGLIQALDQNEAQLQAQLDEAHEASEQARQEVVRLAGRLKEAELALASLESAQLQLQAELEQERAGYGSLPSQPQLPQHGKAAREAGTGQAQSSLNGSESSLGGFQAQLGQLGVQHASELEQERAASQRQESSLRQQVKHLTARVEEQRQELAASSESRADLVEQQQVLAGALALREQEVRELRAATAELHGDLGILEATLRASIDSRADAHERAEQLQQRLHEAAAELERSQASAQALAEDLLESERESMQLSAAAAQAAEEPQALAPGFDRPHAEQPRPPRTQHQLTLASHDSQALLAGLTDSVIVLHQPQDAAADCQELADGAAENLMDEDEVLQDIRAQPGELSARKGDSTGDLAGSEAEGSETLSTQLRMSPLHEQSSQPGPAESEASEPPCSQLGASPVHEHAAQPGHEARPDAALDQARTAIVPAEPDLEVGQGMMVQLELVVRETAGTTPAVDAQACTETASSVATAAAEPEKEYPAPQDAAEAQECQQCNDFAQQLEDCIREYEGSQAEVRQLSQQLAAVQQGRECPQCTALAQQLEACMQAAEARCLHISQQVFARGEAAQQAQRQLAAVTEERDALAASLAEHMATLSEQATSLQHLQELLSQHEDTVLGLQEALSAVQQGPGDLSCQVDASHEGMTDPQVDMQGGTQAIGGQAEVQQQANCQAGGDLVDMQSLAGKLRMELAALTADRDHYRAGCEASCRILTQLRGIASEALGEAKALGEQSAALDTAKNLLSAQLAVAQGIAAAEIGSVMGQAAELEAKLEQSQRTAQDATEAMQSLAAELKAALLEAARCRAREQYALRELHAQLGQLPDAMQLRESLAAQAPSADPASPAGEGQAQKVVGQPDKPVQDTWHLAEALVVQRQPSAASSSAPHCMLPPEECLETTQLASEQGSPVHSILLEADKAMVPSHKAAALSPVSDRGSPRAMSPPVAGTPAAAAEATQEAQLLSPMAAEQTPAAVASVPWTQRAASQPGSSLLRPLPEEASPSDRLQWLASQVAYEANAWEETGAADVGIMGRSHLSRTSAGLSGQTHTLEATAKEDEAGEQLVARLRLERRLLRGITNLAVAVTNDALTGSSHAAVMARRAAGFMCANQEALDKAGLAQTWASLFSMAHHIPCPDRKLLRRENELQEWVLKELDGEAVEADSEHGLLLGQAARDVASLCQTIYETFPGLDQSVPGFGADLLGPCSLRPAEMLELQVSRCKSGIERLLLNLLSADPERFLLGNAAPRSPAQDTCDWQDFSEGVPEWDDTPEIHRIPARLEASGHMV